MLRPIMASREHILVFGQGGSGKTKAILELAAKNADDKFYVVNNDFRFATLMERGFPGVENVELAEVALNNWKDWIVAVKDFSGKMEKDDWLVLDLIGPSWTAIQHDFIKSTTGMDYVEYVAKLKKERKDAGKGDGGVIAMNDWGVINPEYQELWGLLRGCKGHVYATAEVKQIDDSTKNQMIRNTYGAYGVYPKGNSYLYHNFDDVLLFKKNRVGEYVMTSVKTTGREEFEDQAVGDWTKNYLRRFAGWREEQKEG